MGRPTLKISGGYWIYASNRQDLAPVYWILTLDSLDEIITKMEPEHILNRRKICLHIKSFIRKWHRLARAL
jgi:hypothetical protein